MTAVIIPALNAAQTLGELLKRVQQYVPAELIIVVDDGSTDSTAAIASALKAHVIRHAVNGGKGAALKSGFSHVLSRNEISEVIVLDADLQHDPDEIPMFLERWRRGDVHMIVGARRQLGSMMPFHRRLSNVITSALVSARAGVMIKDSQSGYRCISTKVLAAVDMVSDGYEAETEFLIRAARKGFIIDSIPIATIYGKERSHMTHWETTKRFLQVLMREY
jgi:glycosyltransferase involved in cell wall biosynthesis